MRPMKAASAAHPSESDPAELRALERELQTVRGELQSTIDDLETTVEEMKSGAEEYQSVNEELQSSNEELETAKEEMQSINEELQTVNAEISAKNDALTNLNSDLKNLLDSTRIATIFLDNALRVKNFTPAMTAVFPLRESDRGRPVTEIVSLLEYDEIGADVAKVLQDLGMIEREVSLKGASTAFLLRIRPYRTIDNVIDGVVMTFVDITERKRAEEQKSLLLAELDHRVRNILAIVSSVVTQTLKTTASHDAFAKSMEGRIVAISRAHSALTQTGGGTGASLRELVDDGTRAIRPGRPIRVDHRRGLDGHVESRLVACDGVSRTRQQRSEIWSAVDGDRRAGRVMDRDPQVRPYPQFHLDGDGGTPDCQAPRATRIRLDLDRTNARS